MATGLSKLLIAALAILIFGFIGGAHTYAGVVTDGSVGPRVRLEGDFEVSADLGRRAGGNLFHSFERFSLATGERATFSGPAAIRNVIGRVTGGARSDIDGTIASTIPGADFYLINPAGIAFGPNARLDLQGSFHVSTADELRFADGAIFSAADPAASSFTVAAPEAFGFLGPSPAPILVDQSVLDVRPSETLSIVGGDIVITGGPQGFIRAEAGQVTLAAVGGPGDAQLRTGAIDAAQKADISLTDRALVTTSGDGGGTIRIRASSFVVAGQSLVLAINRGASPAAGGIDVDASRVEVSRVAALAADAVGPGPGGNVRVDAADVRVNDGVISSNTFGDGNAGSVAVRADHLLIQGGPSGFVSGISSNAEAGIGNAGSVQVVAGDLQILEGGSIGSGTFSSGHAGTVTVKADRLLIREGASGFFTGITSGAEAGTGDAGSVQVAARDLQILDGGKIRSDTFSSGDAGSVTVRAGHLLIRRDGTRVTGISSSAQAGTGDAGSVQVVADLLEILDGATIATATFAEGKAGDIKINADRLLIRRDGSEFLTGITSSAQAGARNAGSVQIAARELAILGGGQIVSATFAAGNAGTVTVEADRVLIRGRASGILSSAGTSVTGAVGLGDAGSVRIEADRVAIDSGGIVASFADGPGTAGDVILRAADRLILDEGSITTSTAVGGGGEIQLLVGDVIDLRNSAVITSVAGGADPTAGSILIDPQILIIDGSRIQANARLGFGGRVTIVADNILVAGGDFEALLARGEISASGGDPTRAGTIAVNAPEVDLSAGLVVLEGALLDTAPLRERCGARRDVGASSFTGVGRAGLPPTPDGPLGSMPLASEGALEGVESRTGTPTQGMAAASDIRLAGLIRPCAPLD